MLGRNGVVSVKGFSLEGGMLRVRVGVGHNPDGVNAIPLDVLLTGEEKTILLELAARVAVRVNAEVLEDSKELHGVNKALIQEHREAAQRVAENLGGNGDVPS